MSTDRGRLLRIGAACSPLLAVAVGAPRAMAAGLTSVLVGMVALWLLRTIAVRRLTVDVRDQDQDHAPLAA